MKIIKHCVAVVGITAVALAASVGPAQAATVPPSTNIALSTTAAAEVSVDTVYAGDSAITGHVTGPATSVSIVGILPGRGVEGLVAADGSFRVEMGPFANHLRPMQTLTINLYDKAGIKIGSSSILVEFKSQPENPAPERDLLVDKVTVDSTAITGTATGGTTVLIEGITNARPGAIVTKDGKYSVNVAGHNLEAGKTLTAVNVDSRTLQPLGKQTTFIVGVGAGEPGTPSALHVDPIRLGQTAVTGLVPSDFIHVAVEIHGTTEFGTIDSSGNFSIPMGRLSYALYPGLKASVWAMNKAGEIIEAEVTITR